MKACILFSARDARETLKRGPCSPPERRALGFAARRPGYRVPPGAVASPGCLPGSRRGGITLSCPATWVAVGPPASRRGKRTPRPRGPKRRVPNFFTDAHPEPASRPRRPGALVTGG